MVPLKKLKTVRALQLKLVMEKRKSEIINNIYSSELTITAKKKIDKQDD